MRIISNSQIFLSCLFIGLNLSPAFSDTYYCESSLNQKKHPTSLKLTTFGDGTASAVLDDESIWIEPHRQIRLGPTGVFYRFDLKPEITTRRESSLELYLSRLSLKLYGKRKDRFEGQVISVKDYNQLQCYKEPVIELFDDP